MKRKLLCLTTVLCVILSTGIFSGTLASKNQPVLNAEQIAKNTRTTLPPRDNNGKYLFTGARNNSEVVFSDETRLDDPADANYIARMAASPAMTVGGDARHFGELTVLDGTYCGYSATNADFAAGNAYYDIDFGIASKVTEIQSFRQGGAGTVVPNDNLPAHIKVQWSNDRENWSEQDFLQTQVNGTTKDPLALTLNSKPTARYFRLVFINPTQADPSTLSPTATRIMYNYMLTFYNNGWIGDGDGTEASPFLITSKEELLEFGSFVNNSVNNTADKFFKLTTDIDLTGASWTPISSGYSNPFRGTLDGDGHIITGLSVGTSSAPKNVVGGGFFGYNNGVVKNLGFETAGVYLNGTSNTTRLGVIAGYNQVSGVISGCYANNIYVSLDGAGTTGVAGGLTGDNAGTVRDCYVTGESSFVGSSRSGGIVGDRASGSDGVVENCYIYGFADITNAQTAYHDPNAKRQIQGNGETGVSNSYYYYTGATALTSVNIPAMTAEEFADGTVLALLNSGANSSGSAWVQGVNYPELRVFSSGSAPFVPEFIVRGQSDEPYELTGTITDDYGGWGIANISDNNPATYNSDTAIGAYTTDLGEDVFASLSYVRFYPATGSWGANQLIGAEFQGSTGGVVYETLAAVSSVAADNWNIINLDTPSLGYRYFRFIAAPGKGATLAELHWFGQWDNTVSDFGTHLQVNTKFNVKNTFSEAKQAANYIALFDNGGKLINVSSISTATYAKDTNSATTVNHTVIPKNGVNFVSKSMVWSADCQAPLGKMREFAYDAAALAPKTEFVLPNYYVDNMVMQRNKPLKIAGAALPGTEIAVTFDAGVTSVSDSTTASGGGNWSVEFPAQEQGGPYSLTVESENQTKTVSNIYIGEVFICAGQSNMEFNWSNWGPQQDPGFAVELNVDNDRIKFIVGAQTLAVTAPQFNLAPNRAFGSFKQPRWAALSTTDNARNYLSEIGLKTAKDLSAEEPDLYIGVISIAIGGARLEPWLKGGDYYNKWLLPFKNYRVGAYLWYQGESDAPSVQYGKGDWIGNRAKYMSDMAGLINDWRELGADPETAFLYVQLARHSHWAATPYMQDVQRRMLTNTEIENPEHIGMVLTLDTDGGTGAHPTQNTAIHPGGKAVVGARLARLYRSAVYGENLVVNGPLYQSSAVDGSGIVVTFSDTEDGLSIKDVDNRTLAQLVADTLYGGDLSQAANTSVAVDNTSNANENLQGFQIAGADGKYVNAEAVIESPSTVRVSASAVPNPVYVRYGFDSDSGYAANPNLVNEFSEDGNIYNLPASPFATDW